MKNFLLILTLFSSEIQTIQTTPSEPQHTVPELPSEFHPPASPSFDSKRRRTRQTDQLDALEPSKQDDKWIWGYADIIPYKSNKTHENLQASPQQCTVIRPEIPYFTSSVQRISEKNPSTLTNTLSEDWLCWPHESTGFEAFAEAEIECAEYLPQIRSMVQQHKQFPSAPAGFDYYSPAFIGGRKANQSEFPHMGAVGWKASVGDDWVFKCGSTLISTNFVLTAAHCTKASSLDTTIAVTDPKIVRFGVENLSDLDASAVVDKKIKRIIVNPQYKAPDKYNDIALMEIYTVTFTHNVYPVCLWNSFDTSCLGTQSSGAGWGVRNPGKAELSKSLQVGILDIIDTPTCEYLLRSSWNRHWCGFQDHQICAGKLAGGVDSCKGDSGGPLQVKIPKVKEALVYYVIGVTSFGFGCALKNSPGIYTRVSSFIDWIENNVWQ